MIAEGKCMERKPEVHRLKTLQPYFREVKERKKNGYEE